MTWRTAFTNLATISVTGVTTSYDLNALPNALPAANLPALAPYFPEEGGSISQNQHGLATLTYNGAVWSAALYVDHVLYLAPAWSEAGLSEALPSLVTAIDNYLTALAAQGTLSGALSSELEIIRVQPGIVDYAGVKFYGVRFRHLWRRTIP